MAVMQYFLHRFRQDCEAKEARFVVTHASDMRVRECARCAGVESFGLLPTFQAAIDCGRYERVSFPGDSHWNEDGHRVVGEALARFVSGRNRVATEDPPPIR